MSTAAIQEAWDSERNDFPCYEPLKVRAKHKIWLKCGVGHSYLILHSNAIEGIGCGVCAGKQFLQGFNDLASKHPTLIDSYSSSNTLSPYFAKGSSSVSYIWECGVGHLYSATVGSRLRGRGCGVCSGKTLVVGINDLKTTHPEIAKQWRDSERLPSSVTKGSHYEATWECEEKHLYKAQVYRRTNSKNPRGCSVCAGKQVVSGSTDAAAAWPHLIQTYSARNTETLSSLSRMSSKIVLWECEKGHEWETSVKGRISGNSSCPVCSNRVLVVGFNDLQTLHPEIASLYSSTNPEDASAVPGWGKNRKYLWECDNGHVWKAPPDNVIRGSRCPDCVNRISAGELDVLAYIKSILPGEKVLGSQRILKTRGVERNSIAEVDIYIPSKGVGVEFNGVFYHSEYFKDDINYHKRKRLAAEAQNIRLITVWSDDWNRKQDIVKRMLASKLGVSVEEAVYARNLSIREVSYETSTKFLEENHIQGKASGTYYVGGFEGDNLVAVMVLTKRGGSFELTRYATAKRVIGGHSKLVKWVFKNTEVVHLITFADLDVSDGALYQATGWVEVEELSPDYKYVVHGVREHKFNYRLKRFREDKSLKFEAGLTEKELASLNGLWRVWDSGKKKYEISK